jgi:hypothetical protein
MRSVKAAEGNGQKARPQDWCRTGRAHGSPVTGHDRPCLVPIPWRLPKINTARTKTWLADTHTFSLLGGFPFFLCFAAPVCSTIPTIPSPDRPRDPCRLARGLWAGVGVLLLRVENSLTRGGHGARLLLLLRERERCAAPHEKLPAPLLNAAVHAPLHLAPSLGSHAQDPSPAADTNPGAQARGMASVRLAAQRGTFALLTRSLRPRTCRPRAF